MSQYRLVAAAAAASVSLFGCGTPTPAPAPAPEPGYAPADVTTAWNNHFAAFGGQNVSQIMLDYDDESVLQVLNDDCVPAKMEEYKGVSEIETFFTTLFTKLTASPDLQLPKFSDDESIPNPTVKDGNLDAANVFLVWSSSAQGIEKATDTFLFKSVDGVIKIKKQNIVESTTCSQTATPAAPDVSANSTNPIAMGWANHLAAFGAQNRTQILLDYDESSNVQVWDWTTQTYTAYSGLAQIGDMFDALWTAMNFDGANNTGLALVDEFPRVELDMQSVFLGWSSKSHPKATDTFLFDSNGIIKEQTIVVTTKANANSVVV